LARDLNIADLVSFTGKYYGVELLLPRHRAYVHSALMENCPFALIEAYRSGLPVIAGAVGGVPEILGKNGAGRAWDLTNPAAGAETLISFLSNKDGLSKAGATARLEFETKYDAAVAVQKLVQFLKEVSKSATHKHG
jgi:glycosyltransferase involved in cell wall biosynthesis